MWAYSPIICNHFQKFQKFNSKIFDDHFQWPLNSQLNTTQWPCVLNCRQIFGDCLMTVLVIPNQVETLYSHVNFRKWSMKSLLTLNEAVMRANMLLFKNLLNTCEGTAVTFQIWKTMHNIKDLPGKKKGFQTCKGKTVYSGWHHWVWPANGVILNSITYVKDFSWKYSCITVNACKWLFGQTQKCMQYLRSFFNMHSCGCSKNWSSFL